MLYSPKKFYKDFPKEKMRDDTIVGNIVFRPLSFLISSLFALMGIGANTTSIISLFFSLSSSVFLMIFFFIKQNWLIILSFSCYFIWGILDCVDGNLARSIKKEKFGDFFDAVAGYVFPSIYLVSFSFGTSFIPDVILGADTQWIIFIACICFSNNMLFLLSNKKYNECKNKTIGSETINPLMPQKFPSKILKIGKRIWSELSFGGFMPLILLASVVFKFHKLAILFYSAVFLLLSISGFVYLLINARRHSK